jgi:hypothetical protein
MQLKVEYQEELGSSFSNECIHFRSHLSGLEDNNLTITVLDLYKIFKDPNISSLYPYIEIALRMYGIYVVRYQIVQWNDPLVH